VFEEGDTLIEFELAPVLQLYVLAPLAVRTPELPAQIVAEFTLTEGVVLTDTVDVAIPEQLPFVPVTV
jgi:hypothetical protein